MQLPKKFIFLGISGGALGITIITIIVGIVGFNSESYFHDDKIGIELGMMIDANTQEIHVWIHAPRPLYIKSTLANIVKFDSDGGGDGNEAALGDLFPIGETTFGGGDIIFEIYDADEDIMPDLSNRSQSLIPMAYVRKESQFPLVLRYMLLIGAGVLNHWTLFKFIILFSAVLFIVGGFALRYKNKMASKNEVVEIKEPDVDVT